MSDNKPSLSRQGRPKKFPSTDMTRFLDQTNNMSNTTQHLSPNRTELNSPVEERTFDSGTRLFLEESYGAIFQDLKDHPFADTLESKFKEIFNASNVIVWMSKKNDEFYSPTLKYRIQSDESIIVTTAKAQTPFIISNLGECLPIPSIETMNHLVFPLTLLSGTTICIAHVLREYHEPCFDDFDIKIASFLMNKFRAYGTVLLMPFETVSAASEVSSLAPPAEVSSQIINYLTKTFHVKQVDFWCFNNQVNTYFRFEGEEFVKKTKQIGIVSAALKTKQVINCLTPRYHPNFSIKEDVLPDEPLLIGADEYGSSVFGVCLRGHDGEFSVYDETRLKEILPFISRSLSYSTGVDEIGAKVSSARDPEEIRLSQILDGAALFANTVDTKELKGNIQSKIQDICNADSVKFFTKPGAGGFKSIVLSGQSIAITDPQNDARYAVEKDGKYQSFIGCPVLNSQKEVIGGLIVKYKNRLFSQDEQKSMNSMALFAGIAYENAYLIEQSYSILMQYSQMLDGIDNAKPLDECLEIIKKATNAIRVSLLISGPNEGEVYPYVTTTGGVTQGIRLASEALSSKSIVSQGNIACAPLETLGALEIEFQFGIMSTIQKKLVSSAAGILINRKDEISRVRTLRLTMIDVMDMKEMEEIRIPKHFILEGDTALLACTPELVMSDLTDDQMVGIIFAVFEKFGLLSEYNIAAYKLFAFIHEIRNSYNEENEAHNWRHAVSVFQFVAFELLTDDLDENFSHADVLSILVAALVHDAKWEWRGEGLGELLQDRCSVMEQRSVETFLSVLSYPESNIFGALPTPIQKEFCSEVARLVLSTDMRKHFDQMNEITRVISRLSYQENDHVMIVLELLLKIADLNDLFRPYAVSREMVIRAIDEFLKCGDLSRVESIIYTNVNTDRSGVDVEHSIFFILQKVVTPAINMLQMIGPSFEKLFFNYQKTASKYQGELPPDAAIAGY